MNLFYKLRTIVPRYQIWIMSFVIVINSINLIAQNLVKNSQFDEYEVYTDQNSNIVYSPKFWHYKTDNNHHPVYFCVDDFLNHNASHPDAELIRKEGSNLNYVLIPILPIPEKIFTEFTNPLIKNQKYKLSVDIKIYAYATCFTDLIVAFNSQKLILHIPDTINWDYLYHNWLTLSTEFKAKGNEKYLIIGEGNSSDYVQIIRSDSIKNLNKYDLKLSYLIDNVFLIPTIKENMDVLTNKTDSSKIGESFTLHDILFDFNKFGLCCESITTLNPLVCYLKTNLNVELLIIGHTDNEGSDLYNKNLSYNRAKSVVDYLITKGVSASRLKYRGEGANKPISTNVSEEGRKKNRRVEIQLINK